MENYDVIGMLGEGSFGRVYKAKQKNDGAFVALKVISKRGRSNKELKGLRRECKIQKDLNHPNIIQMLNSFETDNEIVVITEFAHKELNYVLGKEGYLPEVQVQKIVWDLVSALYYLHSHRVLHRDLKPQNILLDANNVAKLCDFGFARNMSTGTHVLTSIKGTPLYMAPELIEEQPYDHNADLWSLGCIMYQLLVGTPPFCTPSILHLIRLIRHEQIKWPTTLFSEDCSTFLKGLLQKDPGKRLTWPEILSHPFVKDHIIILENNPAMPLTRVMSANTLQIKEKQRTHHITQKEHKIQPNQQSNTQLPEETKTTISKQTTSSNGDKKKVEVTLSEQLKNNLSLDLKSNDSSIQEGNPIKLNVQLDFHEDNQPIENDEWMVFLQKTVEEIMNQEIGCLLQPSSTNILVNPLRNVNVSPRVVGLVASLFSLPFIVHGIDKTTAGQIEKVYLQVKLLPNLLYAMKLLTTQREPSSVVSTPTPSNSVELTANDVYKSVSELKEDDLQAIERILLLISHLVYLDDQFLSQFCDAVVILNICQMLQRLFALVKSKVKIVTDLVAILTQVLRKNPDVDVVNRIILNENYPAFDFVSILRSRDSLLQERCCYLLLFLGKSSSKTMENLWSDTVRDTLEALMYDSIENVRNAAETAVEELHSAKFYKTSESDTSDVLK